MLQKLEVTKFKASKVEQKLLHYTKKAMQDYNMVKTGDRVLVCLSGGKDSYTMLMMLKQLSLRMKSKFEISAFTLDQSQPGWDDREMRAFLDKVGVEYKILTKDTYSIVKEKIPENQTYCSLCSRLRRGIIYNYARENGFNKIALGHHRDDLIQSLLMSIMYKGEMSSMPPKLLTDSKDLVLIRPLVYCQEKDIIEYMKEKKFPIIPCNLCGSQQNLTRVKIRKLLNQLALENPKVPSNMLNALSNVKLTQLMDRNLHDFKSLES